VVGFAHAPGTRISVEPKIRLGPWLGVAVYFLWISLANMTLLQAGVIVVGIFLKPHDVAIYSAAAATSGLAALPVLAAVALGAPKFAALHAQHRHRELQALFTNIIRLTLWPSLAIAVFFVAFGSLVLRLFGPGFEQAYPVLLILTLGQLVSAFVGPVANLLNMTGHHVLTARVQTAGAILAVVGPCVNSNLGERGYCYRLCGGNGAGERLAGDVCRPQARNLSFPFPWGFKCADALNWLNDSATMERHEPWLTR
jgi:O-antigen/teichoic acid export membrane protein